MTVQSYNGALEFGLTACRRALPDLGDLADYVVDEHRKLHTQVVGEARAAAPAATAVAAPAPRKTRPRRKAAPAAPAAPAAKPARPRRAAAHAA
jgi:hypothetical protein